MCCTDCHSHCGWPSHHISGGAPQPRPCVGDPALTVGAARPILSNSAHSNHVPSLWFAPLIHLLQWGCHQVLCCCWHHFLLLGPSLSPCFPPFHYHGYLHVCKTGSIARAISADLSRASSVCDHNSLPTTSSPFHLPTLEAKPRNRISAQPGHIARQV